MADEVLTSPRRRRPHDHAQPARRLQRDQPRAARGPRGGARRGRGSGRSRGRAHRRGARLLLRTGSPRVPVAPRRRARGARADVPPEHPRDPGAREAGDRGGQRPGRGGRPLAGVRVRRSHRLVGRDLRAGLHRDRARARRRRHVVPPPPARVHARVRVDGLEPPALRGRGSRVGARLGGRRRRRGSHARVAELAALVRGAADDARSR